MIDLRRVESLKPLHVNFNLKDFSCKDMKKTSDRFYQCADSACSLKYGHFIFVGYLKNPNASYPEICHPENILSRAMVCRPGCQILKLSETSSFYMCAACNGNFLKHPEFSFAAATEDWINQDPRVLKYMIKKAQDSSRALRKEAAEYPDSDEWKILLAHLDEAEKIFVTEILSKCRL